MYVAIYTHLYITLGIRMYILCTASGIPLYTHIIYCIGNTVCAINTGFHTEGGPGISHPPRILKISVLKEEEMAVVLHTSDGKLGAVS